MLKDIIKKLLFGLLTASIRVAGKQQGIAGLKDELERIVPDISGQYTTFSIADDYTETKVRMQHAFQVAMALKAIDRLDSSSANRLSVADIGDSAGTHIQYLEALRTGVDALSVNLDPVAVEKIRQKGGQAILCRAEELHQHPDFQREQVDVFLSYETLEHLFDPIHFMKSMSDKSNCKLFVLTVPYKVKSQVGLHQLRNNTGADMHAEDTHIFELCPEDWKLIFRLAGWRVIEDEIYRQYPRFHPLSLMKRVWRKLDFEGFYGCILMRDSSESSLYRSW